SARATASTVPPASNGTTILTVRSGKSARATGASMLTPRAIASSRNPLLVRVIRQSSFRGGQRLARGIVRKDPVARKWRRSGVPAIVLKLLACLQLHLAGTGRPLGLVSLEPIRRAFVPRQIARQRIGVLERDGGALRQRRHHRMRRIAEQRDGPIGPARQRIAIANAPFVAMLDVAE